MKNRAHGIILVALVVMTGAMQSMAGEWLTDFEKAKSEAVAKKVPMIANFSGSDWCGWCIKLDNEVFAKEEFVAYAKDNFVLLHLDFPRSKPQSKELKKQNKELAAKYNIKGFPTVLILDASGEVVARTGYQKGGPESYIKHLEGLISKQK